MEASCLELALEGERLCKAGDFKGGTAFFEAAVQVGTEDLKTLSAIYSQLGNAYFYLKEYGKALEYHKHDLTLARWWLYPLIAATYSNNSNTMGSDDLKCPTQSRGLGNNTVYYLVTLTPVLLTYWCFIWLNQGQCGLFSVFLSAPNKTD